MEIQFQTIYYVYIVTNVKKNLLSVGITINLAERLLKLKEKIGPADCRYLVYYEEHTKALDTVIRESKLSAYSQRRLRNLVKARNPGMQFLYEDDPGNSEYSD